MTTRVATLVPDLAMAPTVSARTLSPGPLLAFDTATERISIALAAGDRIWSHEGEGGARASATFLPAVMGLLAEAGVGVGALDAIAFGRGPGAFTGLRVACSVAQGLAFGAARPVLPIDTLLALAEDARAGAATFAVWALLDARMGEIYAAEYAFDAHGWDVRTAPMLTTPQVLERLWQARAPGVVAGNALVAFGSGLDCGGARRMPEAAPRATGMLALARALWSAGGAVDPALALPLYLRDKVAQTTAEREARAAE
jgi:tRNA threonylcarbamoyladenosine biosynthesis protein TsaB